MEKQRKKLGLGDWVILLVNWIFIVALLMSYVATFINPRIFSVPQLFSIIFPILLIGNVFFVFYWIWKWKKYFLYSLIVVLLGLGFVHRTFNFSRPERIYASSFSVMSYNVRLFNVYKWDGDRYTDGDIFELVRSNHPDILCLQEFLDNKKIHSLAKFKKLYPYYFISYDNREFKAGEAIFSRYRILNKFRLKHQGRIFAIVADIKLKDRIARVINVHLRPVAFEYKDYNSLDSLKFNNRRLRQIIYKLTSGYRGRQQEVEMLNNLIDTSSIPVILCGDFNDTPLSFTYTRIEKQLTDAFSVAGMGLGNTYREYFPILRIDYIFVSDDFRVLDFRRIKVRYSDHYPVYAELSND